MVHQRKRLSQAPRRHQYQCLLSHHSGPCPQCQAVVQTFEDNLTLLKKITNRVLQDPDQVEDYVHEFYHKKLSKKTHKFRLDDPKFQSLQYMIGMLRNFILDERGRRARRSIIEGFVTGLTREEDDLILPDMVTRQVEARAQLERVHSVLRRHELELINQVLSPTWDIKIEAERLDIQVSAVRARINRVRAKLRKLIS